MARRDMQSSHQPAGSAPAGAAAGAAPTEGDVQALLRELLAEVTASRFLLMQLQSSPVAAVNDDGTPMDGRLPPRTAPRKQVTFR